MSFKIAFRGRLPVAGFVFALAILAGCERADESGQEQGAQATAPAMETVQAPDTPHSPVVDITVSDFTIQAPDEVPAGWNTFRLSNQGQQTHFVVFYRIVDGKTIEDQKRDVVPVFDNVMAALNAGEVDKAGAGKMLGDGLPSWAFEAQYRGGPGLLAPGKTVTTTINLDEPGTYLMECYVKSTNGIFHTSMGMLRQVTVVPATAPGMEPTAHTEINVSNGGVEAPASLPAGKHVFRVNFVEDPDAFMPYDIHLVRLGDSTDMDALVSWMDWMNVDGLRAPAPATFIGGIENTPAGRHAYLEVGLEPGRYAWISEINAASMLQSFAVE